MKIEVEEVTTKTYHVTLNREQIECLTALIYSQMSSPGESPLAGLDEALAVAMGLRVSSIGAKDDLDRLVERYRKFVKG